VSIVRIEVRMGSAHAAVCPLCGETGGLPVWLDFVLPNKRVRCRRCKGFVGREAVATALLDANAKLKPKVHKERDDG
jgi:hypothetical protein